MRLLIGTALGIALCAVFPELPTTVQSWINTAASEVAVATDPSTLERAESALTDWRNQ